MKPVTGVKAGQSARAYVSQASYDSGGGLDRALLGNGRWEDWDYNERKQVVSIKLGSTQGAGDLLTLGFGYGTTDNNGNVLSQTIARPGFSATQTYTYDAYNRIQKVQEGTEFRDFAYKEPGNLYVPSWSTGAGWAPGSFTPASPSWFDGNNRLVNAVLGIQYDAAGNLTAIGGFTFAYDAENRLVSSTLNSVTTNYVYDGEGRRVKKGSVVMVYDAFGRLAAEYGGTADPVGTEYLTADHLGSTRLVTSSTGTERRCLDYLPFGEQMTQGMGTRGACYTSANEPRVKFTGKERDQETGLDYFGERYYSSSQGRFTTPDALIMKREWLSDPQRWNRYAYVRNNPLRYIDPNGEDLTVVYSTAGLSDENAEWFKKNKAAIFAAVQAKFKAAGVDRVHFKEWSSLTKEQQAQLGQIPMQNKRGETFVHGLVQLNLLNNRSELVTAGNPYTTAYGFTNSGRTEIFLDNIGEGGCGRVCATANIIAHEFGHALGLEGRGHGIDPFGITQGLSLPEFGREVIMGRPRDVMYSGDPNKAPFGFNTNVEKNVRILQEVNRVRPIYP